MSIESNISKYIVKEIENSLLAKKSNKLSAKDLKITTKSFKVTVDYDLKDDESLWTVSTDDGKLISKGYICNSRRAFDKPYNVESTAQRLRAYKDKYSINYDRDEDYDEDEDYNEDEN